MNERTVTSASRCRYTWHLGPLFLSLILCFSATNALGAPANETRVIDSSAKEVALERASTTIAQDAQTEILERLIHETGEIVVIFDKSARKDVLEFHCNDSQVARHLLDIPTTDLNLDYSLLIEHGGRNAYFVAVWNKGVRAQHMTIHSLAQGGKAVFMPASGHEIYYKIEGAQIRAHVIVSLSEPNSDGLLWESREAGFRNGQGSGGDGRGVAAPPHCSTGTPPFAGCLMSLAGSDGLQLFDSSCLERLSPPGQVQGGF